jgi:hypothetical protein
LSDFFAGPGRPVIPPYVEEYTREEGWVSLVAFALSWLGRQPLDVLMFRYGRSRRQVFSYSLAKQYSHSYSGGPPGSDRNIRVRSKKNVKGHSPSSNDPECLVSVCHERSMVNTRSLSVMERRSYMREGRKEKRGRTRTKETESLDLEATFSQRTLTSWSVTMTIMCLMVPHTEDTT